MTLKSVREFEFLIDIASSFHIRIAHGNKEGLKISVLAYICCRLSFLKLYLFHF